MKTTLPTLALFALMPYMMAVSAQDCGGEPTEPTGAVYDNFDDTLSWTSGGCSDTYIYASASGDTLGLFFVANGLVAQTQAAGHDQSYQINLAGDTASLTLREGTGITSAACNDVVVQAPEITGEWTAVSGTAVITIGYDPDGGEFDLYVPATLVLVDVALLNDLGELVQMEDFGPVETFVGWLPG